MLIKVDFHIHSNLSYDGILSYEEIKQIAKDKGLDAVAICDHETPNTKEDSSGTLVIPGVEISTKYGHVLGLFIEKDPIGNTPDEIIQSIIDANGIPVLAHPYEHTTKNDRFQSAIDKFYGIEGINGRAAKNNINANRMAIELAKKEGKIIFAGTDSHTKDEIGSTYAIIEVKDRTVESIKEAVLNGGIIKVIGKDANYYNISKSQNLRLKRKNLKGSFRRQWFLLTIKCILLDIFRKKQEYSFDCSEGV